MSLPKMDKKFGKFANSPHFSHIASHSPSGRTKGSPGLPVTTLSIEIVEVRDSHDKKAPLVGGPYVCILEVVDPSIQQTVWKQKSSAQFTTKPPIIFGDVFKVRNMNGDWGLDIKPGYVLKVQFCKMTDKSPLQLDYANISLEDLIVNKEQQKEVPLHGGNAEIVLRLTLSNAQYPRGTTITLGELGQKEKEKEEKEKEKEKEPQFEPQGLQRTASYHLPRVVVRFSILYHTVPGEDVRIVGSNPKLGDWDAHKAPPMVWSEGGTWRLEIPFRKITTPFEYKYVVYNTQNGSVRWETAANRKVEAVQDDFINREDAWDHVEH